MNFMFETEDEARGYIAALIDGEGTVIFDSTGQRNRRRASQARNRRTIRITNTDASIIEAGEAALAKLGVPCKRRERPIKPNLKPVLLLDITRQKPLRLLHSKITLRCVSKQARFDEIAASWSRPSPFDIELPEV